MITRTPLTLSEALTRTPLFEKSPERNITRPELDALERALDALFVKSGIDIEFTDHFFYRLNHERNRPEIRIDEIEMIFREVAKRRKLKNKIKGAGAGFEAILKHVQSKINIPFAVDFDRRSQMIELIPKTVMRKKKFKTKGTKVFRIEGVNEAFDTYHRGDVLAVTSGSGFSKKFEHYLKTAGGEWLGVL